MNKQDKIFEAQNLSVKIKEAKAVAVADYRSVNVLQINQLRDKIKEVGGELQVVKNSLFLRALKENKYKVEDKDIEGPSLAIFANEDEIAPMKAIAALGKTLSLLPFKIGFMAGKIFSGSDLTRFASLPPKIELQAKLVGALASPPRRLVYSLNWNLQKLVLILNAVKNKKQ